MSKQPTSLIIDSNLWKEIKIEAIRRGITLTELIEYALRKELDSEVINKNKIKSKAVSQDLTVPIPNNDKTVESSKIKSLSSTFSMSPDYQRANVEMTLPSIGDQIKTMTLPSIGDQIKTMKLPSIQIAKTIEENHNQIIKSLEAVKNQIITTVSGTTRIKSS